MSFLDTEEDIVNINPREKIWMMHYEDYRPVLVRDRYLDLLEDAGKVPKHNYNYPPGDSDFGNSKGVA